MAAPMRESGKVHNWLPFKSEDEARHALFTYAIHANLPDAALIWTDATGAKLLQQGKADKDGDVQVPIAHAHGPIPPPIVPPPPPSMLDSFENTVAKLLDGAAKDAKAAGQDLLAARRTAGQFISDHPLAFDGVATGFDAIAVLGGFVAIATLGAATVGTLGLIAIGAGFAMLLADGSHFGLELLGQKFKSFQDAAETEEHNPLFETVQWIAPILCFPDLVFNTPKAIREVAEFANEAKEAKEAATVAGEAAEKAENRLQTYVQKRESDPAHPVSMTRIHRYEAQIAKTKQALKELTAKSEQAAKDARNRALNANFAGVGITGSTYGDGTMIAHPPNRDGFVKSAFDYSQRAIAAGWYDLGSWFAPTPATYPVMPDAGSRVYHGGFHGGYFSRAGDDPWSDMKSYLSIHMATTRVKPR